MDKSLVYLVGWYQMENGKNQETGKACLSWHSCTVALASVYVCVTDCFGIRSSWILA